MDNLNKDFAKVQDNLHQMELGEADELLELQDTL